MKRITLLSTLLVSLAALAGGTANLVLSYGGSFDPFFADVVLLMHYEGTDGEFDPADFIDDSLLAHTFTTGVVGSPQIDTAQFKFGVSSGLYAIVGGGPGLDVTGSNTLDLGTMDFTIEGWVRFRSVSPQQLFIAQYSFIDGNRAWWFRLETGPNLEFGYSPTGFSAGDVLVTRSWTPSINTWYFVTVCRSGADLRLFVDGVQLGTAHNIGVTSMGSSTDNWVLGAFFATTANTVQITDGWLDDWRFTRGVGRYTANFTPPAAAFPDQ